MRSTPMLGACALILALARASQAAVPAPGLPIAAAPAADADSLPPDSSAVPPPPDSLVPSDSSGAGADSAAAPRSAAARPARRSGTALARLGRALGNFGGDCWAVASSPARLTRRGAAELALVLGAEAALYANDQAIMDAAQRNHDEPVLHAIHKFGDILEDAGFMPHTLEAEGAIWLLGAAFHSPRTRTISEELIESHLIGGGIRNVLKVAVGRAHPFEDRGPRVFEFGKGTSFPSGHTSIYFEVATVLAHHARSRPVTGLLYAAATAGAIQRVQARAHWASDVFLPMVSGTLIARTVVRLHEQRTARWAPTVDVGAEGAMRVGVGRRF